ncbi:MAG: cytochrome c-type biogenesis protein CcmH [Gammaproteobacteria bacterium]|nr:cytochrome c-type biogenesis protein CcmH [Gammaproteobacteria bacterium]
MRRILVLLVLWSPLLAFANIEAYRFDNPQKEADYRVLIAELRCLVCQNQNLADSNAELAQDMRRQTYEMVQSGSSKEEIIVYMVQRYGDFVLYRPPFMPSTVLLWVGPFLIFAVGVGILLLFIRRRNQEPVVQLSSEEHARAKGLLDQETK